MTPPAATTAGRAAAGPSSARARSSKPPAPQPRNPQPVAARPHRRTVRASVSAPRAPRRVSGPVGGALAIPAGLPRPGRPARSFRPSLPRRSAPALPLGRRMVAGVLALPDQRWLDRLVRGRAWIPVLGILLTGIVAVQVEVLKLGASIGRSMNLATQLQSRNQLLRASVAQLSDDQRIMREAARMGMIMPGPTEVQFVPAQAPGALGRAISGIQPPNAQGFLQALTTLESSDGVANPALGTTAVMPGVASASGAATSSATTAATAPASTATSSAGSSGSGGAGSTTATGTTSAVSGAPTTLPQTGQSAQTGAAAPTAPAAGPAASSPTAPSTGGAAAG